MADDMLVWLRAAIEERTALAEASANKPRRIPYREDGEWKYRPVVDDGAWAYDQVKDGYYRGQDRVISAYGEDLGVVAGACRCCGGTPAEGRTEDLLHIVANDPRDTIARCEADLLLLADHASFDFPADDDDGPGAYAWTARCDGCGQPTPCRTVRLLAYGYRRRPGWNPDWAPEGITP